MISIIGVGDIMPGGLLTDNLMNCTTEAVMKVLLEGDIRCGTLECAIGNEPSYDEEKVADRGNVIYAKDADMRRLKELRMDVISLANNHFFDLGEKGAIYTIELLDREGILHCGAGRNLKEAGAPVVVEIKGKKIAFLGFCDIDYDHVYWCTYASETSPGVNPMQKDYVESEIKKYAALYDFVVVLAHWGTEHTFKPDISTVRMAKKMLKAGACLVLGSHPHRVQPVINTKKGSIAYCMGNFLFPDRLIAPPKVTYYPDEPIDYSTLPITFGYPIVKCITLKLLPYLARVGMIVKSEINNGPVRSGYVFSYLNEDNCIELLDKENSKCMQKAINKVELPLRRNCYLIYLKYSKFKNWIAPKVKSLIRRTHDK